MNEAVSPSSGAALFIAEYDMKVFGKTQALRPTGHRRMANNSSQNRRHLSARFSAGRYDQTVSGGFGMFR